jgi:hypothetical protein
MQERPKCSFARKHYQVSHNHSINEVGNLLLNIIQTSQSCASRNRERKKSMQMQAGRPDEFVKKITQIAAKRTFCQN